MSPTRRLLLAVAAIAAVVVLSWAAVSGPVGIPRTTAGGRAGEPSGQPTPTASPLPTTGQQHRVFRLPHPPPPRFYIGQWLLAAAGIVVALLIVVRMAPRLARVWRERENGPLPGSAPDLEAMPDPADDVAAALARGAADQLAAVEDGTPRNGIVAAWNRLEDAAAASGLPRHAWETSAEFTTRLLKSLDVDPAAAGRLAALYRTARFSSHELTERDRDAARDALRRLHDELGVLS